MKLRELEEGFIYTLKYVIDDDIYTKCIIEIYSKGRFSVIETSFAVDGVLFKDPQPDIIHQIEFDEGIIDYTVINKERLPLF